MTRPLSYYTNNISTSKICFRCRDITDSIHIIYIQKQEADLHNSISNMIGKLNYHAGGIGIDEQNKYGQFKLILMISLVAIFATPLPKMLLLSMIFEKM